MPHIIINKDNHKVFSKINDIDKVVILYHWNQCGHCIELMKIWNKILDKVKDKAFIFEVEYSNLKFLPDKYKNILGFPSIICYNHGEYDSEFKNKRTASNIEKFIKKNYSKLI